MNAYRTRNQSVQPPKAVFLSVAIVIFFSSLSAADSVGLVPYYIDGSTPHASDADVVALSSLPQLGIEAVANTIPGSEHSAAKTTLPVRIEIAAAGVDLPVQNPSTRDVGALDTLLQKGPARYADSAALGAAGNVIIFAHSSHLPIVHNQMFRAFNNIPNLKAGDSIVLIGKDGARYLYRVRSVERADVNNDTTIGIKSDTHTLTLVTCDTLTGKSARFILTADFVGIE